MFHLYTGIIVIAVVFCFWVATRRPKMIRWTKGSKPKLLVPLEACKLVLYYGSCYHRRYCYAFLYDASSSHWQEGVPMGSSRLGISKSLCARQPLYL